MVQSIKFEQSYLSEVLLLTLIGLKLITNNTNNS